MNEIERSEESEDETLIWLESRRDYYINLKKYTDIEHMLLKMINKEINKIKGGKENAKTSERP